VLIVAASAIWSANTIEVVPGQNVVSGQ